MVFPYRQTKRALGWNRALTTLLNQGVNMVFGKKTVAVLLVVLGILPLSCVRQKVKEEDRALLVTVEDFRGLSLTIPEDPSGMEKYERIFYSDGSLVLEYNFECDDTSLSDIRYLSCSLTFYRSDSEPAQTQMVNHGVYAAALKLVDSVLVESDNPFGPGEQAQVWIIRNEEGDAVGNRMTWIQDTRLMEFVVVGAFVDDPGIWRNIFEARMAQAGLCRLGLGSLKYPDGEK